LFYWKDIGVSGPAMAFVVTTVQSPTPGVLAIAQHLSAEFQFLVIGDRKTPSPWLASGVEFISLSDQQGLRFQAATAIPEDSYSRKMLGYLLAFESGCQWIRETDDDNLPYDSFFSLPPSVINARVPLPISDWVNIYTYFSDRFVWPRGFPLERLHDPGRLSSPCVTTAPVQQPLILQSLADGDPDVDAIFRLTTPDQDPIEFDRSEPLLVPPGAWSPFNSQATTWHRDLLPLMYLPSTCSFRMTDIWRSFIAQRLLPSLAGSLVVTSPDVFQARNEHDLMRDFRDEIEGYVGYESLVQTLTAAAIIGTRDSLVEDMRIIYRDLAAKSFFTVAELSILDTWLHDVSAVGWTV
jgi:hypothetical protein